MTVPSTIQEIQVSVRGYNRILFQIFKTIRKMDLRSASLDDLQALRGDLTRMNLYAGVIANRIYDEVKHRGDSDVHSP